MKKNNNKKQLYRERYQVYREDIKQKEDYIRREYIQIENILEKKSI